VVGQIFQKEGPVNLTESSSLSDRFQSLLGPVMVCEGGLFIWLNEKEADVCSDMIAQGSCISGNGQDFIGEHLEIIEETANTGQ